jgi:hypothetical protein
MQKLFFIISLVLLSQCKNKPEGTIHDPWFERTKDSILSKSNIVSDSSAFEQVANEPKIQKYYQQGILLAKKYFGADGKQIGIFYFSPDGQFELRREICPNGQTSFEGIFIRGKPMDFLPGGDVEK